MESNFGFISVLPGALSAYRYCAILGHPLEQYFQSDYSLAHNLGQMGMHDMNIFTKNQFLGEISAGPLMLKFYSYMYYLAEDHVLGFEVVAKKDNRWTLKFVRFSRAKMDVPETVSELVVQYQCLLNGLFATSVVGFYHSSYPFLLSP